MRLCGTAAVLPGATLQGINHEQHQPSRRVPNKRASITSICPHPEPLPNFEQCLGARDVEFEYSANIPLKGLYRASKHTAGTELCPST